MQIMDAVHNKFHSSGKLSLCGGLDTTEIAEATSGENFDFFCLLLADFSVTHHKDILPTIVLHDRLGRYVKPSLFFISMQIDVYQFTEGTLVIDLVDAETKNLVWRGTGTGAVDKTQRSPEEMQADIDKVINKIMASFPPN